MISRPLTPTELMVLNGPTQNMPVIGGPLHGQVVQTDRRDRMIVHFMAEPWRKAYDAAGYARADPVTISREEYEPRQIVIDYGAMKLTGTAWVWKRLERETDLASVVLCMLLATTIHQSQRTTEPG